MESIPNPETPLLEGVELLRALAKGPPAGTFDFLIYCAAVPPHGLGMKNAQAHLQHIVDCQLETCQRCETLMRLFPTRDEVARREAAAKVVS